MAATVCPAPQFVGLDNSGNPLSGGKLYSYSAGTTTNLNTFSDSDLSVPNANPIILDAGGRATVYLSASSYKFKLTSSGDDVIYTQDNVISSAPYDVDLDVPFVAGGYSGARRCLGHSASAPRISSAPPRARWHRAPARSVKRWAWRIPRRRW